MARVYLHSGGIDSAVVRAGTGGPKASQWRTENNPKPFTGRGVARTCQRCAPDRRTVREVVAFLKEQKQPPLDTTATIAKGAPGSNLRRKARAAQARIAACNCPTSTATTPSKTKSTAATKTARGLASTDPYKQVLANDRLKALGKSRPANRPAAPRPTKGQPRAATGDKPGLDLPAIRDWAKQQGLPVPRGRLSAPVIQAYQDLH